MREHSMKITDKIISIPPYISTSWDKVASLYMKDSQLIFVLKENTQIGVPDLDPEAIKEIFTAHAAFLEQQQRRTWPTRASPREQLANNVASNVASNVEQTMGLPFRLFFGTLESINQALQHNANYSDLPPLPPEIASKIELLAKAVPAEDVSQLPNPEPGCNCIYCQMARILKQSARQSQETQDELESQLETRLEAQEEEVSEEELRFEEWDVQASGDKLYTVTNKLDPTEHYSVYLGDPIGCTCGKANCEHIVAVLRH